MRIIAYALLIITIIASPCLSDWKDIEDGLEYGAFKVKHAPDSIIHLLRIEPSKWRLVVGAAIKRQNSVSLTPKQWASELGLLAAINAGMFAKDYRTHVGYLKYLDKVHSHKINKYQSALAFDPKRRGAPVFRIFDLDRRGINILKINNDYASVIQNLRLIKKPRENRWTRQPKKWSEAAIGEDDKGRILFIFTRTAYSMYDFNEIILNLNIGIVAAQHLDGGPPAQMYIKVGNFEKELIGSYETGVREDNANTQAWPLPNVLGIRPRILK